MALATSGLASIPKFMVVKLDLFIYFFTVAMSAVDFDLVKAEGVFLYFELCSVIDSEVENFACSNDSSRAAILILPSGTAPSFIISNC